MEGAQQLALQELLRGPFQPERVAAKLREMRAAGISQQAVHDYIAAYAVAPGRTEAEYDLGVELLDIVSGWCQTRFRVWDT